MYPKPTPVPRQYRSRGEARFLADQSALHRVGARRRRAEFAPHGIELLVVSPGTTQTEIFANLLENRVRMPWREQPPAPAAVVAQASQRAMRSGRHKIILNRCGQFLVYLKRFAPWFVDHWLAWYVK